MNPYLFLSVFLESLLLLIPFLKKEIRRETASPLLLFAAATGAALLLGCAASFCRQHPGIITWLLLILVPVFSLLLAKKSFLSRMRMIILPLFFYEISRLILGFLLAKANPEAISLHQGLLALSASPAPALLYTALTFVVQLFYFCLLLKPFKSLEELSSRGQLALSLLFLIALGLVHIFLYALLSSSDESVMISLYVMWLSLSLTGGGILYIVMEMLRRSQKEQEVSLLKLSGSLLEKNYTLLESRQRSAYKALHDYKKQLSAISSLETLEEVRSYTAELLSGISTPIPSVHSGHQILDAVLNVKKAEAEDAGIRFTELVHLPYEITASAPDLCAILGNQLDNALEACLKLQQASAALEDPSPAANPPFIRVEIGQQHRMTFFKVINSALPPVEGQRSRFLSSKKEPSHGFGLEIIEEAVQKYEGSLAITYADGVFTSTAMIQS